MSDYEPEPVADVRYLEATCHGTGTLVCRCFGDGCICGHHGYAECLGCEDCEGEEDPPCEFDEESHW